MRRRAQHGTLADTLQHWLAMEEGQARDPIWPRGGGGGARDSIGRHDGEMAHSRDVR